MKYMVTYKINALDLTEVAFILYRRKNEFCVYLLL